MKRFVLTAIVIMVASAMTANAAEICTPIEPKEWVGHLNSIHPGQSSATTFFEQNKCDWAGSDQLNGSDGLVFDVEGQAGTGSMSATLGQTSLVNVVVQGYFLDATCAKVSGSDYHVTGSRVDAPTADLVPIPVGAKWMLVSSTDANTGNDMTITYRSDGKDCPKPPKKKKKKKH